MKYQFLFFISLILTMSHGQGLVQGIIIDKITKEPLAFANLVIKNETKQVISDINGKFSFSTQTNNTTVLCSYVGYQSKEYKVNIKKGENFIIELEASQNYLNEVVISIGKNPADEIIRKAIANKELNNPENLKSFKYTSYNKLIYDYQSTKDDKNDSIHLRKKLKGRHFFMMESVTKRKFAKPDLSEEVVIATKVSGFKNPSFATIATDFQPFTFYNDNIKFFNINYLNPIARGSLTKYKFKIEETLTNDYDTTYIISFKPKKNKNFDGLQGVIYINSKKYAVQNVIASTAEKGRIDIKIQQKYSLVDKAFWFPEQLNFVIKFNDFPNKETPMTINGKTYISDVLLNTLEDKEKFSLQTVRLEDDAASKDSVFWKKYRIENLNRVDQSTYRVMDSIGSKKNFDSYLTIIEKMTQQKYPLKYVDIDLSKTLLYNKYEGLRLGTGLATNETISKRIVLGGFVGYGLNDDKFKYGSDITFMLSKENEFKIGLHYQNNLIETGRPPSDFYTKTLFNWRDIIGYRYDQVYQLGFATHFRSFKYFLWDLKLDRTKTNPKYSYTFDDNNQIISSYVNSSLTLNLRFAYKEHFMNSFNQNISTGSDYPILFVSFSKGLRNLSKANFNYNKVELAIEQSLITKIFGTTKYHAEVGYVDKSLPYGLLFTGEGSYDKDMIFIANNTFQTMMPYEFLSDKYVNLFVTHNFGGLLFKRNKFQPNVIVHHNLGWGTLSNQTFHKGVNFKTKDKIFIESGLQLDNLIKINYLNLADIGFGTAIFYRYGYYGYSSFNDNVSFKCTLGISIK